MTVRWKPLMVLSGLFLVIALAGLVAIVYVLVPGGSADQVRLAQTDWKVKRFDHAEIRYKNALKVDGRNPAIHLEMAEMYADWAETSPPDKREERRSQSLRELVEAAKFGKQLAEPRRRLLAEAISRDEASEGVYWAKELVALEPRNLDANYVLAADALDGPVLNVSEAKRHLAILETEKPSRVRTDWVRARIAQESAEGARLEEILTRHRGRSLPAGADAIDRMALLRLRVIDAQDRDLATLEERVQAVMADAEGLALAKDLPPARVTQLGLLLGLVQKSLKEATAHADATTKARLQPLNDHVEGTIETTFRKAIGATKTPDLRVHQAFAEQLWLTSQRERCLEVVAQALKLPAADQPAFLPTAMDLREIAIKAALSDPKDPERFAKAGPYIKELIESPSPRYQGLGHLFQGAIELEASGLVGAVVPKRGEPSPTPKSAVAHLKIASDQWPDSPTAQALYGVALILTKEPGLGRQYLQNARKLGNLEPRYQVWAAWSMVQAGYPEDATPIVAALLDQVAQGKQPKELEPTLHLLNGEIAQARRTPADLRKARSEYEAAFASGQEMPPSVQLRLAQLDIMLDDVPGGLKRINQIRAEGKGGAGAEHLAILTLQNQGRGDEARRLLDEARKTYPESAELVGLDAAIRLKANQAAEADRVLAEFLTRYPGEIGVVQMRAQLLAETLNRVEEARKLLNNAADRSENSAPLVQLALLDLGRKNYDAVAQTIAKIRGRWKEAAAADLLDAQLALALNNTQVAVNALDSALKKDPTNKIALFWKAQLSDRGGSAAEAAKVYESIAHDRPVKELEDGLSLTTAAQWALATLAMENQDLDGAIDRFEGLLKSGEAGELARPVRWKLVAAHAAKNDWRAAKAEIVALLKDPKTTPDEIVQAANFYRMNQEEAAAQALLDPLLKTRPDHSGAVVTRAYMLTAAKKNAEAAALLRKAIAAPSKTPQPSAVYLMLTAIENMNSDPAEGLRSALAVVDSGLKVHPDAIDLIKAHYAIVKMMGDPKGALAFVESRAKADPQGHFRRLLVELYGEQKDFTKAEAVVRALMAEEPKDAKLKDPRLAATLVRLVAAEAGQAADRDDRHREVALNEKTAALIHQFRAAFPDDLSFLEADCELVARRGDFTRAVAITREMDKIDQNSPAGPLLRAQLYAVQGWTQEEVKAYAEALNRNPRRSDVRLAQAQGLLALGKTDEAIRQAEYVLDADHDQPAAQLVKARALAAWEASPAQVAAHRDEAVLILRRTIQARPKFSVAYHQVAEIQMMQGRRPEAIATLKEALKAVPDDAAGLAMAIQLLSEPRADGKAPTPAEVQEARALADARAGLDSTGQLSLASAIGFHKAGQLDMALPWAEKAIKTLDAPAVHLTYGDLLLSVAEATPDQSKARAVFARAVEQYDLVLKAQANSVEAINNKAWILHRYLGNDREALALADGLVRRVDPSVLPADFFDTLGAVQESLGKTREAEDSYAKGLRKVPGHPILNYHMGRLVAKNRDRSGKAKPFLLKAHDAGDKLPPAMVAEVDELLTKVGR